MRPCVVQLCDMSTALHIRNFDADLLQKLKVEAAVSGKTLRDHVTERLRLRNGDRLATKGAEKK